jgi:hypothetical protein
MVTWLCKNTVPSMGCIHLKCDGWLLSHRLQRHLKCNKNNPGIQESNSALLPSCPAPPSHLLPFLCTHSWLYCLHCPLSPPLACTEQQQDRHGLDLQSCSRSATMAGEGTAGFCWEQDMAVSGPWGSAGDTRGQLDTLGAAKCTPPGRFHLRQENWKSMTLI